MKRVCRRKCRCATRNPYQRWAGAILCVLRPMEYASINFMTPSQIRELFSDRTQADLRRALDQDEWNDMMRREREYSKLRGNSLYDWMMKRKAPSMDHKSH